MSTTSRKKPRLQKEPIVDDMEVEEDSELLRELQTFAKDNELDTSIAEKLRELRDKLSKLSSELAAGEQAAGALWGKLGEAYPKFTLDHAKKACAILFPSPRLSDSNHGGTKIVDGLKTNVDEPAEPRGTTMPDLFVPTMNERPKDLLLQEIAQVQKDGVAPFLGLIQSSGYGKTRTLLEVAKSQRVVYLLCKTIRGGWACPQVMANFIKVITDENNSAKREEIANGFLQAVVATAQLYKTPDDLYKAQFTDQGNFSKFYDELLQTYNPNRPVSEGVGVLPRSVPPADATDEPKPLVVVFDESKTLGTDDKDTERSAYRCIRRKLRESNLIGVFLDTFGSMSLFLPECAASDRAAGIGTFQPPIFEIDTFDQFAADGFLFMGRPLWKMNWEYRDDKDLTKLVKFAAHKLTLGNTAPPTGGKGNDGYVAIFLCRFGLNPTGELAKRLVASHMATLVGVSVNRMQLLTKYKSEPILAEASAYLTTCGGVSTCDVLREVFSQIQSRVLTSDKGDPGEIAAAAWFGYTLDNLRKPTNPDQYSAKSASLSREVEVLQLIKALCPHNIVIDNEVRQKLQEWTVNVTHFCRLGYSPTRRILALAWKRRVGFYLPEGEEGIDILITASTKKNEEKFATIRVQVKNYKNNISEGAMNSMFQKLDVRRCAPVSTFEEEPLSIAFLVQVGEGEMKSDVSLQKLGRQTRQAAAEQVQIACSFNGNQDSKHLRAIAGAGIENTEFTSSSEHFRGGELFEEE